MKAAGAHFLAMFVTASIAQCLTLANGDWRPKDSGATREYIRKKEVERIRDKSVLTKDEWLSLIKQELEKPQVIGGKTYPFAFEELLKLKDKIGIDLNAAVDPETGDTLLHRAVQANNSAHVSSLIRAGADVEAKNKRGHTALASSLIANNPRVAKTLLKAGASKEVFVHGRTFRQAVLRLGSVDFFRLICPDKASLNARDPLSGQSVLFELVSLGTGAPERAAELVRDGLRRGADVMAKNINGESIFDFAVNSANGNEDIAILIAKHPRARKAVNAFLAASDQTGRKGVQKLLAMGLDRLALTVMRTGASGDINSKIGEFDPEYGGYYYTALDDVVSRRTKFTKALSEERKRLKKLKQELRSSAALDESAKREMYSNVRLAESKISEMTKALPILRALESEIRRAGGKSGSLFFEKEMKLAKGALYAAAITGQKDKVAKLIKRGVDVNQNNGEALYAAVERGHKDVVKLLLDRGADIHADQDSALVAAVKSGRKDLVALLLDRGADIHANKGQALSWAALKGHKDVVMLLLDRGADIHADNNRAITEAASFGRVEVVTLLLDRGASIDAEGGGAYWYALVNDQKDVLKLLLDRGADVNGHCSASLIRTWTAKDDEHRKAFWGDADEARVDKELMLMFFNYGADPYYKNPPRCPSSALEIIKEYNRTAASRLEAFYLEYLASAKPFQGIRKGGSPSPAAVSDGKGKTVSHPQSTSSTPASVSQGVKAD